MSYKEMSLTELVQYRKTLETELPEGETVPDEVAEMAQVASQLIEGKIDQAARFKESLTAHIEAIQLQLTNLQSMLETTEELMKKAVIQSGGKRLDGLAYSIRIQANGRASTVIEDPMLVPLHFHKITMAQTLHYSDDTFLYWVRAILGRIVEWKTEATIINPLARLDIAGNERVKLERIFKIDPSKSMVEEKLKKDPNSVPGAHLEKGFHLRVTAGGAKPKTKEIENG